MITQQDIDQFYVDFEKMGLKKPVATMMALVPGLSSGNVSEYLSKKKKPSERFIRAFYDNIYKTSIDDEGLQGDISLQIIYRLTKSVEKIADANLLLAQKINSPRDEKASERVPPEGTGSSTPYKVRLLSGRKKQTDTDQE